MQVHGLKGALSQPGIAENPGAGTGLPVWAAEGPVHYRAHGSREDGYDCIIPCLSLPRCSDGRSNHGRRQRVSRGEFRPPYTLRGVLRAHAHGHDWTECPLANTGITLLLRKVNTWLDKKDDHHGPRRNPHPGRR